MLINLWYVAEWSSTVKDKPVKARMLGQDFVLFRDRGGQVHCLSNVCLHRGGSLANGWTTDRNCVACPYHGWEFQGDGKVGFIPSLGEGADISDRARIDSYPVQERYGMIWVFLGDLAEEQRYPIPPFPEYDSDDWKEVTSEYTWKADASRVVENGIDIAHTSFVHPVFGYPETAHENHIERIERHDWMADSSCVMYPPKLKGSFGLRSLIRKDRAATHVHPKFFLPGFTVNLRIDVNARMSIIMFDANTPVDERTTRTFAIQLRNFFKWKIFDKGSEKRLVRILLEDARIVENASPYQLPENLANEFSVKQDKFMGIWRNIRRRHIEEKGWQIDTMAMAPFEGKKVFTIPSPQRRERADMEWVLDPVPLVAPTRSPLQSVNSSTQVE